MKLNVLIFILFTSLVACNTTIPKKKIIVNKTITYTSDSVNLVGYLAYDSLQTNPKPGVLIVHEWWGLNDYVKKRADSLAKMGYVALALDMYGDGKTADHPQTANAFASMIFSNLDGASKRFDAAMQLLKAQPKTDKEKIAAIGYCFGGAIVLNMARLGYDLDAVASFHGGLGNATGKAVEKGSIKSKILVCNGAADPFVSQEEISNFETEMKNAQVEYSLVQYPKAVHAFSNPGADTLGAKFNLPLAYQKEADEQSWSAMSKLLESVFK